MKKLVGKTFVFAAAACALPLVSVAQNLVSQAGIVNRSVERLTLLPGPNLLSPARNTPSMAPAHLKLGAAPTPFYGPSGDAFLSNGNSVYLPLFSEANPNPNPTNHTVPGTIRAVPGSVPGKAVIPDFLRFDHRLEAPPTEIRWQFQRGPRRI
jgi:hypothetical protein